MSARGRAIVVTGRWPWPLDDGGRIDLWQSIHACRRAWNLTLISLVDPGTENDPLPAPLAASDLEVIRIPHRRPSPPAAAFASLFGPWPYPIVRARSGALERRLGELVRERAPDLVWLNQLHTATALDAITTGVRVLRQQNVEHVFLERYAASRRSPFARAFAAMQAARMRKLEARLCSQCDLVLAVQDLERDALRRLAPDALVETLPIGVNVDRFLERRPASPPAVLLTGSFGWAPNAEGAVRFIEAGWPAVRDRIPGVRLRLAGKGMTPALSEAARRAGAEPVGYVNDMAPEFARAAALVVPLWVGAGARVKIIEALAAGVPVVSTPLGAEGLELDPGQDYLSSERPEGLGQAVLEVLENPPLAERLSASGRARSRERYSLDAVSARVPELVEAARSRRRQ